MTARQEAGRNGAARSTSAGIPTSVTMPTRSRTARARRYLMCPPLYFDVRYSINPWMDVGTPVDPQLAMTQWERLRELYLELGHKVEEIEPLPGLPDMVFAANGATVVDGRVLVARFRHAERVPETPAYLNWFRRNGFPTARAATAVNEGEGDFLVTDRAMLAGTGFRSDATAHIEAQEVLGRPVIRLRLVDPRFYHLDTALAVLDGSEVMYYPGAFDPESRAVLRTTFPDALLATEADAEVMGLNAVSDGRHVLLPEAARGLFGPLRARGFEPIGVNLSELLKAGGSVKCCTLEIRDQPRKGPATLIA